MNGESARGLGVGIKALRSVLGAAEAAGIDANTLVRAHGLATKDLRDPDFRLPYRDWIAIWDDVVERAGDPGVGLHAAEALAMGHWDVIDYIVASSDTLGDAIRRALGTSPSSAPRCATSSTSIERRPRLPIPRARREDS